jgi:hypothetical protein
MDNAYYIGIPVGVFALICIYLFGKKEHSERAYHLLASLVPWFNHKDPSSKNTPGDAPNEPTTCLKLPGDVPDMDCCTIECKPAGLVNAVVYCKKELCNSNVKEENKNNTEN